jgi:hypothetical protein
MSEYIQLTGEPEDISLSSYSRDSHEVTVSIYHDDIVETVMNNEDLKSALTDKLVGDTTELLSRMSDDALMAVITDRFYYGETTDLLNAILMLCAPNRLLAAYVRRIATTSLSDLATYGFEEDTSDAN